MDFCLHTFSNWKKETLILSIPLLMTVTDVISGGDDSFSSAINYLFEKRK